MPQPIRQNAERPTRFGALYFGSTSAAMREALGVLTGLRIDLDVMRLRAFPFPDDLVDFILAHDQVFVIEQNRDAQLRALIINEAGIDPARLTPILHYDGTPITARFIVEAIRRHVQAVMHDTSPREAAE